MTEVHMMTMDDLHEEMRGGAYWRSTARRYESLWRSALLDGSMCADHIKGDVVLSYAWDSGEKGELPAMHSDFAEKRAKEIAIAAVFNALADSGSASVTDVVRSLKAIGTSEVMAQYDIDQAVRSGALKRVRCSCQ